MGEILGLTDEEQLEVYRAVVDLVKSRIDKAKSVGKKRKTKEGIDIDALVETVMNEIGDETLGKFYRENILTQKTLSTRNLPKATGEIRIERDLLGWRLRYGGKYIECHSEEEARYLRIFLETGLDEVKIPEEEEYLRGVLPEIEELKTRTDKIINAYLESIVNKRSRAKIEHQLWTEIWK